MSNVSYPFQFRPALADQVEADVSTMVIRPGLSAGTSQLDGFAGHRALGQLPLARDLLGGVAIAVARRKVHPAINTAGVLEQGLLDDTLRLDKFLPIHRTEDTQAADAVADRHLVGGLQLVLGLNQLRDAQTGFRQVLLDPGQRQRQRRPPPLQATDEFGDEGAGHRRLRARHVGDHQNQVLRIILGGCRHPVRPIPGQIALVPASGDARTDPPQILDHRQAQHDRDRPQFAQPEIGDGLIGRHEAIERFRIDPPVAMRDGFQRNVVDTGMPGRRPGRQTGQFAAVAFRQMPLGGADLFLDQVEVVEQPLAGRGDPALFGGYRGQPPADTDQRVFVGRQAIQQAIRDASRSQPVRCRQRPAVLGHLVGAIQLRAQRRVLTGQAPGLAGKAQSGLQLTEICGERRTETQTGWPFQKSKVSRCGRIVRQGTSSRGRRLT